MYKYTGDDPSSRTLLTVIPSVGETSSMTISADGSTLYVCRNGFTYRVNALTGQTTFLGNVGGAFYTGDGMAIFVPEPGTLCALLAGSALVGRQRRCQAAENGDQ